MNVTCHLRRRGEVQAATALLVFGEARELLALCGQLQLQQFPIVHRVAGGFLIRLPAAIEKTPPGAVRLRALADNLFMPVDAELLPALRPDEARGLMREVGQVYLPAGVLAFDPQETVSLGQLITAGTLRRRDWQPLPAGRPSAERIVSIRLELPDDEPDFILEQGGGDDIGVEPPPRPEDASLPARAAGHVLAGMGRFLHGLGSAIGWKGLANLGADWVKKATQLVPRLSESLLGKQEAALRELLRQFREGNIDQALRRALPLGDDSSGRGPVVPYTGTTLPFHQLFYSLSNLIGRAGGVVPTWFGGHDVQRELAAEYRRAAEQAIARGDFRRAAFIYGKLLNDYSAAANALMRGQLHHDAAVLYLRKLNDRRSAARAFELAGEFDTALELWRQLGDHLSAGDLLQRMGDEEAALLEFTAAADELAGRNEHLAGYQVLVNRARRPDLGRRYLEQGWARRPEVNGVACGSRLAQHLIEEEDVTSFQVVLAEGRATFAAPGDDVAAAQFFNAIVALADRLALAAVRADVRDSCLLGLATKLKQRGEFETAAGDAVSMLLGRSTAWAAPVMSDARFAFAQVVKQRPAAPAPRPVQQVRIGVGVVTAACHAPATGDVIVGFLSGDVLGFSPQRNAVYRIKSGDGWAVSGLAASASAAYVAVLQNEAQQVGVCRLTTYSYTRNSSYRQLATGVQAAEDCAWLSPVIVESQHSHSINYSNDGYQLLLAEVATLTHMRKAHRHDIIMQLGLCLPQFIAELVSDGQRWLSWLHVGTNALEPLPWGPTLAEGSRLWVPPFSWCMGELKLLLAGIDNAGKVRLSHVPAPIDCAPAAIHLSSVTDERFCAAAIIRPGLVAGVAARHVSWLREQGHKLVHCAPSTATPQIDMPVACFASPLTSEVLIVCRDGRLARVLVPAGI